MNLDWIATCGLRSPLILYFDYNQYFWSSTVWPRGGPGLNIPWDHTFLLRFPKISRKYLLVSSDFLFVTAKPLVDWSYSRFVTVFEWKYLRHTHAQDHALCQLPPWLNNIIISANCSIFNIYACYDKTSYKSVPPAYSGTCRPTKPIRISSAIDFAEGSNFPYLEKWKSPRYFLT